MYVWKVLFTVPCAGISEVKCATTSAPREKVIVSSNLPLGFQWMKISHFGIINGWQRSMTLFFA